MRVRAVFAGLAVLGLVLVGPASAATAIEPGGPSTVVQANGLPFGSSFRDYMLNITGKFLGNLTPDKWRREIVANQYRNGLSGGGVQRMAGLGTQFQPGWEDMPQTPEEYAARNAKSVPKGKDPHGKKSFRMSPVNGSKFMKGLGALSLMSFEPLLASLGADAVGGAWFGMDDVKGEFCAAEPDSSDGLGEQALFRALGLLSGTDCDMFGFDPGYELDPDTVGKACFNLAAYGGNLCYQPVSIAPDSGWGWDVSYAIVCMVIEHTDEGDTGVLPGGTSIEMYFDTNWGLVKMGYPIVPSAPGGTNCNGGPGRAAPVDKRGESVPLGPMQLNDFYFQTKLQGSDEWVKRENVAGDSPDRVLECVVTLTDGTVLKASGAPYKEADGSFAPPACPDVPPGKTVQDVAVDQKTDQGGGTYGDPQRVFEEEATPEYTEWVGDYPECVAGDCLLDLSLKSGDKLGVSCFSVPDGCPDWFEDPSKTSNYQCTYGLHNVDLEECNVYSGVFQPGRVKVGAPYSDPMTGEWSGGENAPGLDRQAMGQGIQDPGAIRACDGMALTGFDPVGFILRPVQCALEWAFVPRPVWVEAEMTGGEAAWEGKPPAVIASAVGSFAPAPSASGCSRSVTIFQGWAQSTVTPIDACSGSWMAPVAVISKIVTSAAMVVLVVIVLRRQISGMVGYNQGQ